MAESDINTLYGIALAGDRSAEDRLFNRLRERFGLFVQQRIGNKQDAEEIIQESLMVIAEKYKDIEIEVSFTAWAYRVLENKLLSYYRTKKGRAGKLVPMADDDNNPDRAPAPDPSFKRRLLDCLKKVNRANTRHARILNLHYQGYTIEDICGKFSITRNNVYIILSRARTMLKICLETGDIA